MEPAIILLSIFSVPLTAILSSTWLKAKKLQLEHGGSEQLKRLEEQNADLRRRMEVLESIAIDSRAIGASERRQLHLSASTTEEPSTSAGAQALLPGRDG